MTIDERIERLTERHEALVQTIELMSMDRKAQEEKWDKRFGQLVSSLEKLTHIAELHQHRLDSHTDRLDTLEGSV